MSAGDHEGRSRPFLRLTLIFTRPGIDRDDPHSARQMAHAVPHVMAHVQTAPIGNNTLWLILHARVRFAGIHFIHSRPRDLLGADVID